MPFDYGFRLNNRQRIANAKPIEANKNQSVDRAEGLFLSGGSSQNVYLLPQRQNFRLERCPRPKQIYDHPNNEPDKILHPETESLDSGSTASQIEFATGTTTQPRSARGNLANCLRSARIYSIFVSAAISSLPSAVLIVSCTCSPPLPAGIVAEMRFPFFGSAFTESLNNTASPRFTVTRNGVAGSILKN